MDRDHDRDVSFLELFFDLVFVVVIAQLAGRLAHDVSWSSVGWFAFLFFAVWQSWINGTLYHELHGTNDISARVFTFGQMLAIAVMAVFIGHVPGNGEVGFALAYAANTLLLVVLWYRTGLHDPTHRSASIPYSVGYLIAAALFAASALVEGPARGWMWAVALACQIGGFVIGMQRWTPPIPQDGDAQIATTPSLIERLGLFVIIVLGEVIVGAVDGMAELDPLAFDEIVIGLLGVIVAIGLWWIYFDLVSHRPPISSVTQVWLNLHLPLVIGIAAGGAAVLATIENANEGLPDAVRWLLAGSLSVAMFSVALIVETLQARRDHPEIYRYARLALVVSSVLCLGVGFTDWGAKGSIGAMVLLLLAPVGVGVVLWLRHTDAADLGEQP